jgi:hypothetical protein
MSLSPALLEILVCPASKEPLIYFEAEGFLLCPVSRRRYRVEDDIPVLLIEEAETLDQATVDRWVAQARERGLV